MNREMSAIIQHISLLNTIFSFNNLFHILFEVFMCSWQAFGLWKFSNLITVNFLMFIGLWCNKIMVLCLQISVLLLELVLIIFLWHDDHFSHVKATIQKLITWLHWELLQIESVKFFLTNNVLYCFPNYSRTLLHYKQFWNN